MSSWGIHLKLAKKLNNKLNLDYGFKILNKEEKEGWNILKTLTNHSKLNEFEIINNDEIYDKRNIEIEKQLSQLYGTNNFNYEVWYKNVLHNVYTYFNGNSYEYLYYIE